MGVHMLMPILYVWLSWLLVNIWLVLYSERALSHNPQLIVYVVGSPWNPKVIIRPQAAIIFHQDELEAVLAHERGHIKLNHMRENFLVSVLIPFVLPFRRYRREAQEIEADDYAVSLCGHLPLARALLKISDDPFDIYRAQRLMETHWAMAEEF